MTCPKCVVGDREGRSTQVHPMGHIPCTCATQAARARWQWELGDEVTLILKSWLDYLIRADRMQRASLCVYPHPSKLGRGPRQTQCERPLLAGKQKDKWFDLDASLAWLGLVFFLAEIASPSPLQEVRNQKHSGHSAPELKT